MLHTLFIYAVIMEILKLGCLVCSSLKTANERTIITWLHAVYWVTCCLLGQLSAGVEIFRMSMGREFFNRKIIGYYIYKCKCIVYAIYMGQYKSASD